LSPGDNVTARCQTPPSYPPPNVTWYLNGLPVSQSPSSPRFGLGRVSTRRHQHPPSFPKDSTSALPHHHHFLLQWTESFFSFNPSSSIHQLVRCEATVYTVYNQSATLSFSPVVVPPRLLPPDPLPNSAGKTSSKVKS